MIPVSAKVHPVKDYYVFAIDLSQGPYSDLELDVKGKGGGRPATVLWIKKTTFPLSIKINSPKAQPIPIDAEETPLVLDGVEIEKLYVTVTATSGVLFIVAFYPK